MLKNAIDKGNEPHHDKTNKMACAPSKDSDQPRRPPSLIRVFAVSLKKARILSYPLSAQQRLWSDWVDAQADLSFRWVYMPFCWFCHDVAQMMSVWRIFNFKFWITFKDSSLNVNNHSTVTASFEFCWIFQHFSLLSWMVMYKIEKNWQLI